MEHRAARIAGWVPIAAHRSTGSELPRLGGLVDVSHSGARVYLSWSPRPGDPLRLGLTLGDGRTLAMDCRVVWARQDAPGTTEAFAPRMHLLRELARHGLIPGRPVYGTLCGVRWNAGVDSASIRAIQRHFEDEQVGAHKRIDHTVQPPAVESDGGNLSLRPDVDRY